jgi:hypothetical protein
LLVVVSSSSSGTGLVGGFVVAGGAAGLAVHESVLADADFEYGLAEAAVLVALALIFRHFALGATVFGGPGSCGHKNNVALRGEVGNVPLVTCVCGATGSSANEVEFASAAEAALHFSDLVARLKSCPSRTAR